MGQEKTLAFAIDITGVSNEGNEMQKLNIQISNLNKEYKDLQKTVKQQGGIGSNEQIRQLTALDKEMRSQKDRYKELKTSVDTAADSVTRMKARLSTLKQEYYDGDAALRQKLLPQVNKLTTDISKAEQAIGVHSRGVGNYKASIKSAAKELFAFVAPAAAATYALNGLKEAFLATERGANLLGRAKMQMSAFFENIVEGNFKYAFGNQLPKDIKAAADLMNEIRIDERNEVVGISKRELEIKNLRLDSIKAGKDLVEQARLLSLAETKENELIEFKLAHKEEELMAVNKLLEHQKNNTAFLDKQAQLEMQINNIKGEKSLRIASKLEAIQAKITKDSETQLNIEVKKSDIFEKKARDETERLGLNEMQRLEKNYDDKKTYFEKLNKTEEDWYNLQWDREDADLRKQKKDADIKLGIESTTADAKMNIANSAVTMLSAIAGKSKAIQKAAMIAERAVAIAEIIMKSRIANMATTAWGAAYSIPTLGASIIVAAAINAKNKIAEIFNIGAVVAATVAGFYKGGKITGGVPINTGTKDNLLIAVHRDEAVVNPRQIAALGGSGAMRRARVPGFAGGGAVSPYAQSPNAGMDNNFDMLSNRITQMEVVLNIHKLNSAQNELALIIQTNSI